MECELVDGNVLLDQLSALKGIGVDGVMVDCWWGIVEGERPQEYRWNAYKQLFEMVRSLNLKLQVLSFPKCHTVQNDSSCFTNK